MKLFFDNDWRTIGKENGRVQILGASYYIWKKTNIMRLGFIFQIHFMGFIVGVGRV